jgi:alkaline phosphatase
MVMARIVQRAAVLLLVLFLPAACALRIERLQLEKNRKILLPGTTEALVVYNQTGEEGLVWTSSDPAVVTVNAAGTLTAGVPGTAVITVSTASGYAKECFVSVVTAVPVNVILFIGDGMGTGAVAAAGIFEHGVPGSLSFESFPYANRMTTFSASPLVTDSAAAATAMATGRKVNNNVISEAIPGDGRDLETVLEFLKKLGKRTGLVTTNNMTGATPAAFGAHTPKRSHGADIASDYLLDSRPNILFGGGGSGLTTAASAAAGYLTVTDKAGFLALTPGASDFYSAQFGTGSLPYMTDDPATYPQLSDMTGKALELLAPSPGGFFLMVEGARIDHAGSGHNLPHSIGETLEFEDAVNTALAWAAGRNDTLIIVTADHETGGLKVKGNNGAGVLPTVSWTADSHTFAKVPLFVWGVGVNILHGSFDNTEIAELITDFYE